MTLVVKDKKDGLRLTQIPAIRNEETLGQIALEGVFAAVIAEAETARDIASAEGHRESLTPEDISNLTAVLGHEVSANTWKNYRSQWRRFCEWASSRGISPLPAHPLQVAAYLAERLVRHGHRPATLQTAAAAICFVHRGEGLSDPCEAAEVKDTLRSARRMAGSEQRQAKGITDDDLRMIAEIAHLPRPWSDGRTESVEAAERRGKQDIALISTMRDGLLRVSETAALTWEDIEEYEDGSGRLYIRRSKTDAEGEGAVAFLSVQTMDSLEAIRGMSSGEDSVFGLMPNGISTRIKEAARAAGLGEGYSGHSPRVGMARDLARAGTELTRLMTAGRWRSPRMPALYTRNETVARGAVAQYYGGRRIGTGRTALRTKAKDGSCAGEVTGGNGSRGAGTQIDGGENDLQNWEESDNMPCTLNLRSIIGAVPMSGESGIKALIHAVSQTAVTLVNYLLAPPPPRAVAYI